MISNSEQSARGTLKEPGFQKMGGQFFLNYWPSENEDTEKD